MKWGFIMFKKIAIGSLSALSVVPVIAMVSCGDKTSGSDLSGSHDLLDFKEDKKYKFTYFGAPYNDGLETKQEEHSHIFLGKELYPYLTYYRSAGDVSLKLLGLSIRNHTRLSLYETSEKKDPWYGGWIGITLAVVGVSAGTVWLIFKFGGSN